MTSVIQNIVDRCEALYRDLRFESVRAWKTQAPGRKAIGYMPIYIPREMIHAAGMMPVGVVGGGDQLEIIRGDAYFQSYICHIPRSTIELGLTGRLDCLDGMIFPSICDVVRNLSGMWKLLFPNAYVHYFDMPQNFRTDIGGAFYRQELEHLRADMERISGNKITDDALHASIRVYNRNGQLLRALYRRRSERPWDVPTEEAYLLMRAGYVLPVEEHNDMLSSYLEHVGTLERREMDNSRVVVVGTFCEQPPLGLIRTLERSGCYIVEDDLLLGCRWILEDMQETGDPLDALVDAFLKHSTRTSSKYEPDEAKGAFLVERCREHHAEGVIFCAPSFCDPALLDQPMLTAALDRADISYTTFKYSEDTGQFGVIREQSGTFADSIKLWSTV